MVWNRIDDLSHRTFGFPVAATREHWQKMHREAKAERPAVYWLLETVPSWLYGRWFRTQRGWWWVRNRLYPRYRPIIRTGLEPGWHDADTMILHGSMAMLVRFIEHEHDGVDETRKWLRELETESETESETEYVPPKQIQTLREAIEIYQWWKCYSGDPKDGLDALDGDAYWQADAANRAKEDEMLKRLIDIRYGLWT